MTLYDLCREINIRKEDNFEFPVDCLQKIKIYKWGGYHEKWVIKLVEFSEEAGTDNVL